MTLQTIDKLDAACRQLNTAISLWFNDGDAVSIHTLTFAAHQIVSDINSHKGGSELIYDSAVIKDEHRTEAIKKLRRHYNFFKHADNDPSGTIEFDPICTDWFIIFTIIGLEYLGRKPDAVQRAFTIYWYLCHPDMLTEKGKTIVAALSEESRQYDLEMHKQQFFEAYTLAHSNRPTFPKEFADFSQPKNSTWERKSLGDRQPHSPSQTTLTGF